MRNKELPLDDLAMYILNAEAVRGRQHKYLKREDQLDILKKMRERHPLVSKDLIPLPHLDHLPKHLDDMIEKYEVWKVEWFYSGMNMFIESAAWQEEFHYPRKKAPWKITDTAGFCRWTSLITLWSNSLTYPDREVFYEGMALRKSSKAPIIQKVRAMSHVLDHDHVISLLCIETS